MSFDVAGITSLVGPNGAGKTTALDVLTGFRRPDEGSVAMDGSKQLRRPEQFARAGVRRTFQTPRLVERATVIENVMLGLAASRFGLARSLLRPVGRHWAELRGLPEVERSLQRFELTELADWPVAELPYGVRRLTEIARAMVAEPRYLVLDEPAAGLNEAETSTLGEALLGIASAGVGVILVEHDLGLVKSISSEMYVLDFGVLIAHGDPDEVIGVPAVVQAYTGVE